MTYENGYLRGLRDGVDLMRKIAREGINELSPEAQSWIRDTYGPLVDQITTKLEERATQATLAYIGIRTQHAGTPDAEPRENVTVATSLPSETDGPQQQ